MVCNVILVILMRINRVLGPEGGGRDFSPVSHNQYKTTSQIYLLEQSTYDIGF